jgi:hypothetical protein
MTRGGHRGGSSAPRGGHRHGGPQGPQPTLDKPKREAILDLAKYANARIRVKFTGGREGLCSFTFFVLIFIPFPSHSTTDGTNESTRCAKQ